MKDYYDFEYDDPDEADFHREAAEDRKRRVIIK